MKNAVSSLHCLVACLAAGSVMSALAQSSDWDRVIWREPQVRYLLTDMSLGGNIALYRDYASREKDPDSREAVRLWEAGVRVINTNDFERRWVPNQYGNNGRVIRIVQRGSTRTISGNEVLLSNDGTYSQPAMRLALLELTLGYPETTFRKRAQVDPSAAEAWRRWSDGCRAVNAQWFVLRGSGSKRQARFLHSGFPADGARVVLNSDVPYPETNARYFLADMLLGGSREFYVRAAESAHEMGCQEAVARFDAGVRIANLEQFERKRVDGKMLITRKGSNERISGMELKLSTD
jgi:hypothetical protein